MFVQENKPMLTTSSFPESVDEQVKLILNEDVV
jgi:hypothetical protein